MLNATWLETFTVLAEEGSFTRTATRLNMTQPGVSQHVRKLEDAVGTNLVQRVGKTIVLTDAGLALRDLGLRRRAEEEQLRERIGDDAPDSGAVGIGCSGSFAALLYPRLMPRLAAAPTLEVTLRAAPRSDVIEAVAAGHLDIGVVSRDPRHPRLAARQIGHEDLCLVTPAASRLRRPDLAALEALGFIDHPDGVGYAEMLMPMNFKEFRGAGSLRRRGFVNQITQIPAPVAAGAGYTILPRSGIDAFARAKDLCIADLAHPARQDLWLIQRAGRTLPARCRWAEQEIERLAQRLSDQHQT